jgi:steroid delta-isomerase-like uncharacterized protein
MDVSASRLATALLAAYNARDAAAAAALYQDDGEHHEVAQAASRQGRPALQSGLERFFAAFPDAQWAAQLTIADAGCTAITYRLTGTLRQAMGPFQPDGQRLEIDGVLIIEADRAGAMIVRTADYWDSGTFARQMRGS